MERGTFRNRRFSWREWITSFLLGASLTLGGVAVSQPRRDSPQPSHVINCAVPSEPRSNFLRELLSSDATIDLRGLFGSVPGINDLTPAQFITILTVAQDDRRGLRVIQALTGAIGMDSVRAVQMANAIDARLEQLIPAADGRR